VKKYSKDDQCAMASWSLDCAERVLHLFEAVGLDDARPRAALRAGQEWLSTGVFSMAVIRRASLDAHAAAKEVKDSATACAAAHAAGQAVATAHVPQHAYGGAYYALKAVAAASARDEAMARVHEERAWQDQRLPERLRVEIMNRILVEVRKSGPLVTIVKGPDF
jgi:hypothetical protein